MEKKDRTAFGARLYEARTNAKLTQKQVREKTGISQGTLSELENEANGSTYTPALAALYGVSALYLASGKKDKISIDMPENSYVVDYTKMANTPVYGKSMGGLPDRLFTDEGRLSNGHDEYGDVYSADEDAFITRVDGNSMYPKYVKGGYALVEPNTAPELEDDVIFKLKSGQVMLKKLISKRNGWHFASYNDPEIHTFEESEFIWIYYVAYPVPQKKIRSRM